ncbi:MAG: ABC transporter ATP-binding protein [Parcubacteria group bacterium]|nr:ABC transporter ATP-binding protein [Parcubacteria group bacterium]
MSIFPRDNRINDIIRLSRRAFGRYKLQIILLTGLGFLSGLLEGVGINAIIPLFSFIAGGDQGSDIISRAIRQVFYYAHIDFNLAYILIFISGMFVLKAVVLAFFNYVQIKIQTDYEERTRNELYGATFASNWEHLLKQKLGHLEVILMNDVTHGAQMLKLISTFIMVTTGLMMYAVIAINISPSVSLITLTLGGVLILLLKPLMYRTRMAAHKTAAMNKEVQHFVSENLLGMKTVKAMSVGQQVVRKGAGYFADLRKLRIIVFLLSSVSSIIMQPMSLIFISVVFFVSYQTPYFNFAALAAIIYLIQRMFQYIQQFQGALHSMNESVPYLKSVLEYRDRSHSVSEIDSGNERVVFNHALEFTNVSFRYSDSQNVLDAVSFSVGKGEMVGLIGPSGAGKTTLVDLLLRLFNPENGSITLDGRNITEFGLREWRRNIGYVSQDLFLMNDTIANNIRFYSNTLTQRDVEQATRMAHMYDFIQGLPNGFETVIGERGVMLSAGQRQRIIIARVLARSPKILVLDEATSSLDNESEAKIQKVIENLKGKITVLAIAHRLSTLRNSDKLIVLDNGKIIEQGSPKELLKDKASYFYKVYNIRD